MQFLVLTEDAYEVDWTDQQDLLKAEARTVWKLQRSGALRSIWFTQAHDAVLLFEADDEDAVQEVMEIMPLVREGLLTYTVLGLQPYTGLERLFKGTDA